MNFHRLFLVSVVNLAWKVRLWDSTPLLERRSSLYTDHLSGVKRTNQVCPKYSNRLSILALVAGVSRCRIRAALCLISYEENKVTI